MVTGIQDQGQRQYVRMNRVIGVVGTKFKSTANGVLNVMAERLEEPMPQPFDGRIMDTSHL